MSLRKTSLSCLGLGLELQVFSPEADISDTFSGDVWERFSSRHRFFLEKISTMPYMGQKLDVLGTCQRDFKAVRLCFPLVQEAHILVVMAAWFNTLCITDDIAERMEPDRVTTIFQIVADQFKGGPGHLRSVGDDHESQMFTVLDSLECQAEAMLPRKHAARFLECTACYLESQIKELELRQHCASLDDYFHVRQASVGIKPFFNLLSCGMTESLDFNELEDIVVHTTVLQNDIVGLERDIKSGDSMNAIILATKPQPQGQGQCKPEAMQNLAHRHNTYMQAAMEHYQAMEGRLGFDESRTSTSIMLFASRHLRWAMTSKRY